MGYSPTVVANNVLMRSFRERRYITPMKLQKILYFVASEYAKRTGHVLLDERFQTWRFGPVSYAVYDEFRPFAKKGIKKFARDASGQALIIDEDSDPDLRDCLDEVWEAAKKMTAVRLSEITHTRDSAWFKAYQENRDTLDHQDIMADRTYRAALRLR
ncbi:Panacea domain-containing protein [Actinomyces gaoshouyii]|uniref:Panacea domain-containing protein n=1 Tax=Actinomyces gaoshouyii TaxID=1960083 RepID=UPI000F7B42D7|nr:type II toxin-antitoxin system antitoxin SocA domain-containing protein [Actinomyces gaoshouyii]